MILAINIDNTSIVAGCVDKSKIYFSERISCDLQKTELDYLVTFKTILELYKIPPKNIEGCIISSVVPQITPAVRKSLDKLLHRPVRMVGPGIKTGLNIKIENPAQLGSTLAVNAVAALHKYQPPIIIADLSTATSLSVIDRKGYYLGGSIMAGVGISLNSLYRATAQLPGINLENPGQVIGRNTIDCMKSGALYGNASMLDGMITKIEQELGEPATVTATGIYADTIVPLCSHSIQIDHTLLLTGLWILYQKNPFV